MLDNPLKIIDLKDPDKNKVARGILNACMNQGFLYVDGHDFTQDEVDDLLSLSQKFFGLPLEEKSKYNIDEANCGYSCLLSEKLDYAGPKELAATVTENKKGDPKEAFNFGDINFEYGEPNQNLPQLFIENKKIVQTTNKKIYKLIMTILRYLSIGLKIDESRGGADWFQQRNRPSEPNGSILRFLKYPSQFLCESNELIRAGAHTDYGTVTLLFQFKDQEGLEIYKDNNWQKVPFIASKYPNSAPPVIVNIGDQLSYWTAGILKSTVHRVRFPESSVMENKDRYSIVFFSHPENDTLLEPIPSDIVRKVEGRGANNNTEFLTAKQHLDKKLNKTYLRK